MTALSDLLDGFRRAAVTQREKGTYFEELILAYLRHEPSYRDLYRGVWTYGEWAARQGITKKDTGIDLVAETALGEVHAIQCKFYDPGDTISKAELDSFFTASGKKPFTHRLLVLSVDDLTDNAEDALKDQRTPVSTIRLSDLEASQVDWSRFNRAKAPVLRARKKPRPHQVQAIAAVREGFAKEDRGKLLMACGTGKTFTALRIAEAEAGTGKRVLFLVPSLALLSQSLTEWTQESTVGLHSFAVCSDSDVGKKKREDSESIQTFVHELRFPATTNAKPLAEQLKKRHDKQHMTVVFSTYHSIDVIHRAQKEHGLADFDLVICDEAHRTTGATFAGADESAFVRVHKDNYLRAKRRLYMTATPRIFAPYAKATAIKENVELASMDDEALYGRVFHRLNFSEAVQKDLLVDYKVIVLAIEEAHVNKRLQALLASAENDLKVDDAAKIVGCWKALSKQGLQSAKAWVDTDPMRRAVAFCQVIERTTKAKRHQVASKSIAATFQAVVEAYQRSEPGDDAGELRCEAQHVDGTMNAGQKESKLAWLKADAAEGTCRILSNVRCLTEGVDVPALDAVLFLSPRNSQVDVVQSVGRVMRKAPGKQRGYVVLPVVIPAGVDPQTALDDNETYRVVWQVLQALRAHDDRFDAMVNKIDLMQAPDLQHMEVVAVTDRIAPKAKAKSGESPRAAFSIGRPERRPSENAAAQQLSFEIGVLERAIYAKLVEKVGSRHYWEDWADDIARIARTHIDRISALLAEKKNAKERKAFQAFATELRDDLNDSITDEEIIEMLAQHLITKPVFEAVFSGSEFASRNPISVALQKVLDVLQEQRLEKEAETLHGFYANVKMRAAGIDTAEGRQRIIVELYDKFFRNAFKRLTERLGIVYTPVEVVDFIIHSVAHLLKQEFNQTLGAPGVHIIDPFTGTGTFITRLLQSGLIAPDELERKYKKEIHANEIVLLAYYIAGVNIEAVYHDLVKGDDYVPFEGIVLTDTFQMYEKPDQYDALLVDNSKRRVRQKGLDIRVIIGNPPYSAGQGTANDNNQNVAYPHLDSRIASTYAARSKATLKNALYDSYVRAIRWASDRVGKSGIVGFVTNAGWVEANTATGLRQCLVEEFSSLYVFHLRGNQRTQGEQSRSEGGKIFGSGSRAPIAISFLVKNSGRGTPGQVYFHDIGDYLNREQKLARIASFGSVTGISAEKGWTTITPDAHGDWINQRVAGFEKFLPLGDKRGDNAAIFENYSNGVKTNRDAWAYNPSRRVVAESMERAVKFYNTEVSRYLRAPSAVDDDVRQFVDTDPTRFSWDFAQYEGVYRGRVGVFSKEAVRPSLYRAFTKSWLYFDRFFNNRVYQVPQLFPEAKSENRAILTNANFGGVGGIAIMADVTPDLHANGDAQSFPLYLYDAAEDSDDTDTAEPQLALGPSVSSKSGTRRDAITDPALKHFQSAYAGEKISKEDLFYYIYGLLHSREYLARYADNLSKELPRIPRVRSAKDFRAFSKAGRELAELHVNYEKVQPYPAKIESSGKLSSADYRVESMKYGKIGKEKDRTTVIYNERITVKGIPLDAHDYVINGRSAIDWVMERQGVWTDKASGIVSDANDYAIETMKNPKYPLELLLRVITVSLETITIVEALPALDLLET